MKFFFPSTFAGSALLLAASLTSAQTANVTVGVDSIDARQRMQYVQVPPKPEGADNDAPPAPSFKRVPVVTRRSAGETMDVGAYVSPVPPAMASQLRIKRGTGFVVEGVVPGGAAERAGIQQYDVISGIDGQPLQNPQQVQKVLAQHKTGEEIPVELIREGRHQTVSLAVQPRPESDRFNPKNQTTPDKVQGFGSFKIDPQEKQKLGEMSDRLKSEIEKQEKRIEELTARIRDEAEQAKRQIRDLKEQIRREAQQQKEQLQRDLKDGKDQAGDERSNKTQGF